MSPRKDPGLPPRWMFRFIWVADRARCRLTGGRFGLSRPQPGRWGTMRLTTIGRRTGK